MKKPKAKLKTGDVVSWISNGSITGTVVRSSIIQMREMKDIVNRIPKSDYVYAEHTVVRFGNSTRDFTNCKGLQKL